MSVPDLQEPLALLEQEDYDDAIAVLNDMVAALPAHLGAHVLLAHAYETQERWEEALQSWAEARFLMPNSPIAETGTQRVLRRLEEHDGTSFAFAFPPSLKTESPPDADTDGNEGDSTPTDAEEEPSPDEDDGLAQLRRQAEREARQGGARPGLSDTPPSSDRPPSPDATPPTPEEQVEQLEDEGDTDDLDHLIDELQSARIEPDAKAEADTPPPDVADEAGMPEDDDTEDIVSETLARIHEGQDDYQEAARIYAALAEQEPDRADEFQEKADEMRRKADESDEDA